jgi:hypothetical protein
MKQQEWVHTRKKLLKKIKAQVFERLGRPSTALAQYAKRLVGEFKGRWRAVTPDELLKAVAGCDVVFGSDFHAHAQSQRAHVRILRALPEDRHIVLALECLCAEDEAAIDAYVSGETDDEGFLTAIDWANTWGFPWENYKPIFEIAKQKGFLIRGISRHKDAKAVTLAIRDERMASDVAELQSAHPGALIYVMVGELHLAHSHLPDAWQERRPDAKATIIYQDAESLYFRLAEKSQDQKVDVLRSGERFCLMVSPPWVKWQSYLTYLEQTYDQELDEESIDYSDQIRSLVDLLAKDLKIEVATSHLQVYTPASKEALKQFKKHLNKKEWPLLLKFLEDDRSFLLPRQGMVYLSTPTLNRAAGMAGEFLHAILSSRVCPLWEAEDTFEAMIWVEAIAFFFSKWINPKRKAEKQENLQFQLSMRAPKDRGRKALLIALDQKMTEVVWMKTGRKRKRQAQKTRNRIDHIEASRILGSMLGEQLFLRFREGEIKTSEILAWLQLSVHDPIFDEFYWQLVKRLK